MIQEKLYVSTIDIDGRIDPTGIDNPRPVIHFTAESTEKCKTVSAYQINVKDENGNIVWDSQKTAYNGIPYITYFGRPLQPKTVYTVKIRLWDENGDPSSFSEACVFETGFLGSSWQAEWIEPEQTPGQMERKIKFFEIFMPAADDTDNAERLNPAKRLRKAFQVKGRVKKARLYASAHGVYQAVINGKAVSDHRLAPEISSYEEILYYQTYDITPMLSEGENILGFLLADGWWIGRLGLSGDSCQYGNRLALITQLEITYEDGRKEVICSDETFKADDAHIRYSDLYIGECQALCETSYTWLDLCYDDSRWTPCEAAAYSKQNLTGQLLDPVKVTESLSVQKLFLTPNKGLVADFGQVIAGVVSLQITLEEPAEIVLEHSEILDEDGCFRMNIIGRNKDQKDVFSCQSGEYTLEPLFTYHGFRYVRIRGLRLDQIGEAKALVIGTDLQKIGAFSCSDPRLNQLQKNICWSARGNMFSIPTDCPQREKMGWTGDIQVFAKAGSFNFDLRNFLASWLRNLRVEQADNGEVPLVVPNFPLQAAMQSEHANGNSSSAWGDACILVPYYLYQCYGDAAILRDNFNAMEKWLDFVKSAAARQPENYNSMTEEQKRRNPYLWTKGHHFGDWLIPSLRSLPDGVPKGTQSTYEVTGSSFYAISVREFIKICHILGETEKACQYEELLPKIKAAVREEYVASDGTVNNSSLQGIYVTLLYADIVEGPLKEKVVNKLVQLIRDNDYRLDTGFVSVPYILDVLTENGYKGIAYKLLYQTKSPSWLYQVEKGATTIWENWEAITPDGKVTDSSYNHYAYGCVGDWIYRHIGGLVPLAPGYKKILISPDLTCGLQNAECTLQTPYGQLSCTWTQSTQNPTRYTICVHIPVDTAATLKIADTTCELGSGTYRFLYDMP